MQTTSTTGGDIAARFQDWVGNTLLIDDEISLSVVRRIAAMVDLDPSSFKRGGSLPPHWYSMFFTLNARQSQIGHDGHPRKGEFLPPIPLPRRMFVGREAQFLTPLHIGDDAVKRSEIASITQKTGRSGTLVFVQVRHTIEARGRTALIEHQHVVYRDAPPLPATSSAASTVEAVPTADWSESHVIDPVLLFRYSAVTWNGHRIHYDSDYARNEENYRGCVMNGALTVHLLVDAALRNAPGYRLIGLEARLSRPMFVGDRMSLCGEAVRNGTDGRILRAWACNPDGRLTAQVTLSLE